MLPEKVDAQTLPDPTPPSTSGLSYFPFPSPSSNFLTPRASCQRAEQAVRPRDSRSAWPLEQQLSGLWEIGTHRMSEGLGLLCVKPIARTMGSQDQCTTVCSTGRASAILHQCKKRVWEGRRGRTLMTVVAELRRSCTLMYVGLSSDR